MSVKQPLIFTITVRFSTMKITPLKGGVSHSFKGVMFIVEDLTVIVKIRGCFTLI
jgi:hypothetical protein